MSSRIRSSDNLDAVRPARDHRDVIESPRLQRLWALTAVVAAAILAFGPDRPPRVVSAVVLVLIALGVVRSKRRRATLRAAVCPRDGQSLTIRLRQWGPRGVPLLQCPVDRDSYYVVEWSPFLLAEVEIDDDSP